jgi:hypothetical protein
MNIKYNSESAPSGTQLATDPRQEPAIRYIQEVSTCVSDCTPEVSFV